MLLLAPPPPPPVLPAPIVLAAPRGAGPVLAAPRGVARNLPVVPQVHLMVRAAMKDAGAIVVVEDELPVLVDLAPVSLDLFSGRVRLFGSGILPSWVGPVPPPVWNDPTVVRQGGNVVGRVFSLGGAGF